MCVFPIYLNLFKTKVFYLWAPKNKFGACWGHKEFFLKIWGKLSEKPFFWNQTKFGKKISECTVRWLKMHILDLVVSPRERTLALQWVFVGGRIAWEPQSFDRDSLSDRSYSHTLKIGVMEIQAFSPAPTMGPVRIRHSSHDFGWQSSHSVDLAGWQAKMASIEIWIPWRNAHKAHLFC